MPKFPIATSRYLSRGSLPFSQVLVYALPTLPVALLFGSVPIIQGIYAKYFGLSLTAIASIILSARLFDAITDPLVGYLSDYYYVRNKNRKIFVLFGGILFIFCGYFLYVPAGVTTTPPYQTVSNAYFLGWLLMFYLAWTLFEIPHLAWGGDLAINSADKNMVFSMRAVGSYLGSLVFFAIPMLPMFDAQGFSPQTLSFSVLIAAILIFPSLYLSIKNVPSDGRGHAARDIPIEKHRSRRLPARHFFSLFSTINNNKPLLIFLVAFFLVATGGGMSTGLMYIFADAYLGLGQYLPQIYLLSMVVGIISIPCWYKIGNLFGKTVAWGIGMFGMVCSFLLVPLLSPSESNWVDLLFLQTLLYAFSTAAVVFPPAILSNIIDYERWKCGHDFSGTYFSLYTLVIKASFALGGAIGLAVAGIYGFDATSSTHGVYQVLGLHLAIAYIPALTLLLSLGFIVMAPLSDRHHKIIRRRLDLLAYRKGTYQRQVSKSM